MRWIVLLAACLVPGSALFGCSSDGTTPTCSEAELYHHRYDPDASPGADVKNSSQPDLSDLVREKCITGPSLSGTGGTGNGGSGGTTGGSGGTGGTGGTN